MGETILALSVRQPWAWAIMEAGKPVENRDWPTRVRGEILIHTSKRMTRAEFEAFGEFFEQQTYGQPTVLPPVEALERGCLLGTVDLVDCVTSHDSPWFFGKFGFVLQNPKQLGVAIPWKGQLGFFPVPRAALANRGS